MNLSKGLKETRADLETKIDAVNAKAAVENRELTTEELDGIDTDIAEIERLSAEIKKAERREAVLAESAARGAASGQKTPGKEEKKAVERFSLMEFFRQARDKKLEGLYAEMHGEAVKEARAAGTDIENFGIPSFLMDGIARRD